MSISDLRQSYDNAPSFDVGDLAASPVEQFHRWFRQAIDANVRWNNPLR